jgi:hypothetical protein
MEREETGSEQMDRIHLDEDRIQWYGFMNAVVKFWVP